MWLKVQSSGFNMDFFLNSRKTNRQSVVRINLGSYRKKQRGNESTGSMSGQIIALKTFTPTAPPASPLDQWMKRFDEAERLVDGVVERIAERRYVPPSLPRELQRRTSEIRRKVAILETRLDLLQEDLSQLPNKQHIRLKELRKLAEKLAALSSKVKEVGAPFTMKHSSNRNDLLGPSEECTKIDINSTADMDSREIVDLQRNVMKEQDEQLDKLEEGIASTKHIALAINEELDLHTRLIDDLDERTEETSNQLQRAQKKLKSLSTRMRKGGSCMALLFSLVAIVICVLVICAVIKF